MTSIEEEAYNKGYRDGIARGQRVVPDPDRFPIPQPDYTMRTGWGHKPLPDRTTKRGAEERMRQKDIDFIVEAVELTLRLAPEDEVAGIKMCAGQIAKSAAYANANLNVEGLLALASDG